MKSWKGWITAFAIVWLHQLSTWSQNTPFVTKWTFSSSSTTLKFKALTVGSVNYSYTMSPSGTSGSGNFTMNSEGLVTLNINIPAGNTLTLSMEPTNLRRFFIGNVFGLPSGDPNYNQLTDIVSWGDVQWSSMFYAFARCSNLQISATDIPDLSNVTDMTGMFIWCTNLNSPSNIGDWDVSNVTNMISLFYGTDYFNKDLNNWNVSNVTNFYRTFFQAKAFNKSLNNWNTGNATDMQEMFSGAIAFNQSVSNWDVSNADNLKDMFSGASSFNQSLGNWTFKPGVSLNGNTSLLSGTAINCGNYTASLVGWANNPQTPSGLAFIGTGRQYGTNAVTARNYLINSKTWSFSGDAASSTFCPTCSGIAISAHPSNQYANIGSNASFSVTATGSNLTYQWQVSTNNGNTWNNIPNAINASYTVNNIASTQGFNVYRVIISNGICSEPSNPSTLFVNSPSNFVTKWTFSSSSTTLKFKALTNGTVNYFYTMSPSGTSGSGNFTMNSEGIVTLNINIPAGNTLTLSMEPTNLRRFFIGDVFGLPSGDPNYNQLTDVVSWGDVQWSSMFYAFARCSNLQISATDIPDLSNVTDMTGMFIWCTNLNSPSNIGDWDVSNVTNMNLLFCFTDYFNKDLNNWNVANVTNFYRTFFQAKAFNKSLYNWNTGNATTMQDMFNGATAFNQTLENWQLSSNVDLTNMLSSSGLNCQNYSVTLRGWAQNPACPSGRTFGATGRVYGTDAVSFRNTLTSTKGWTISGDAANSSSCLPACTNPVISNQPSNQTTNYQSNATFSVTATGSNLTYQWQQSSDAGLTWTNISNATSSSYTLSNAQWIDNNKRFRVVVNSGTCSVTSNAAILTVNNLPASFVTKWTYSSAATSINFNAQTNGSVNYTYTMSPSGTYGSGNFTMNTAGLVTLNLTIPAGNTVTLSMEPTNLRRFYMGSGTHTSNLTDVTSWGDVAWSSMQNAFASCGALQISATDVPNLSGVTNASSMFSGCTVLNSPSNIGSWNVSSVTNMSLMFQNARAFNQSINNWNVAYVTNFQQMFNSAFVFNQPLSNWNTGAATNFNQMFRNAYAFNQNINSWNTQNVTDMSSMFQDANAFNQALNSWNTQNVTTMETMFNSADVFNQPLSAWNVSMVQNMTEMFVGAAAFNQSLGNWTLRSGINLASMQGFIGGTAIDCNNYSATLIGWANNPLTPSNVQLNANGRTLGTSAVSARTYLTGTKNWIIFGDGSCAPPYVTKWTYSSASTSILFNAQTNGAVNYTYTMSPSGTSGSGNFTMNTAGLVTLNLTIPAGNTVTLSMEPLNLKRFYMGSGTHTSNLTDVTSWGDVAWSSMQNAFASCGALQISATDVPNLSGVTNASSMFSGCTVLNSPTNIGTWNVSTLTNMSLMFQNARAFNQSINNWNVANVTNFQQMFNSAFVFNQPLSNWNTGAATNFNQMFRNAYAFNQNINSWNTQNVTDMSSMFQDANAFNQALNSWNTQNVTTMETMFNSADAFNQPLSSWNVSNVQNMTEMFVGAAAFNQSLGNWTFNGAINLSSMQGLISGTAIDCINYSSTLIGWANNPLTPSNRVFNASGRQYGTNAVLARNALTSSKGWIIFGDNSSGTVCAACNNPEITTQPANQTINVNGNMNFSVTATGDNLTYQWQYNMGSGWTNATNETASTLTGGPLNSFYNGMQLRVIVSSGSCAVTSNAATLTVLTCTNPTPSISITETSGITNNDGTICGGASVTLTASGGTSYSWSNGASTAAITVNPNTTTTYTVTAANGTCTASASQTVTVLNGTSSVAISITETSAGTNNDGVVCNGASVTLSASSAQTYSWSNGATTQSITVNPTTNSTYTVSAISAGSCAVATDSKTISIVNTVGSIGNITGPTNVGGLNSATYAVSAVTNATSYNWGLPLGMTIASSTGNSIVVSIDGTFIGGQVTVHALNACSQSATKLLNVSTNLAASAALSISGASTLCQGQIFTYSVEAIAGAQYVWTLPNGIQFVDINLNNNASIDVEVSSSFVSGSISVVRSTSNGSMTATKALSILGTPASITGQNYLCVGETTSFTCSGVSGASGYNWEVPTGINIIDGQGTQTITVEAAIGFVGGNITVQATNSCGLSPKRSKSILMAPQPATISGSSQLCRNTSGTYSITASAAYLVYDWVLPTGTSILSGSNTASIVVQANNSFTSGTLKVRVQTDCGWSDYKTLFISSAPSRPSVISGTTLICGATNNLIDANGNLQQSSNSNVFTYSVNPVAGVSYNWTTPSGASIISGQGTNQVVVSFNTSIFTQGTLSVSASSSCGTSALRTISIAVSRATMSGPEVLNGLTTATYSVPTGSGTAYNWTLPSWMNVVGGSLTSNSVTVSFGTDNCGSGTVNLAITNTCGTQYTLSRNVRTNNKTKIKDIHTINNPDTYTQIFAESVPEAIEYRFKVTGYGLSGGQQVITTSNPFFRMNDLNGEVFGTTYQVQVAVRTNSTTFEANGYGCEATVKYRDKQTYFTRQCGSSVSMNSNIGIQTVLFSTGFKIKISGGNLTTAQEIIKPITFFSLSEFTGLLNGQSYLIQVAVRYQDGVSFGPYNSGCNYTLSDLSSQLIASQCGMSGANLTTVITASSAVGATGYRFRINGSNLSSAVILDKATRTFRFNEVSGAALNNTYNVEVAVLYSNGTTYGPYGQMCSVTLGTSPVGIDQQEYPELEAMNETTREIEVENNVETSAAILENEPILSWDVNVYPNPAKEQITVHSSEKITKIVLMDMSGKVIHTVYPQDFTMSINLDNFNNGMYLMQLTSKEAMITKPFIKQ